jgi:aspartate carbamoyltransferase catalytic subunit
MSFEPQKINGNFKGKDIISLDQFSPKDIDIIFKLAKKMKVVAANGKPSKFLDGKIVTLIFYEPSSRTFGSFGASVKQLGGQTVDILNPQVFSSVSKGETLEDTIRVFEAYCDAIVIRHPVAGTAKIAAEAAKFVPILNAGDGVGEHPTQTLLDLCTINEKHGKLSNLTGVMAGDLLNGRTVHSLLKGLSLYKNNTVYLLSPKELKLSKEDFKNYSSRGVKLIEIESDQRYSLKMLIFGIGLRVQKERLQPQSLKNYESLKTQFIVTRDLVEKKAGKNTIIMHPLPRVGEIDPAIDSDPRAVYLSSQVRNGMYIRMALLSLVINGK